MDLIDIMLDRMRENPEKYIILGDMWQFNFCLLHINTKAYKLRCIADDVTIVDYVTAHDLSIVDWFRENKNNPDCFQEVSI